MKPLLASNLGTFLQRFNNFKESEFRSLDLISANEISLVYAVQDDARAFDWITIRLNFLGIVDAQLLESSKMSLLNMSDGICLNTLENNFVFGSSECPNATSVKDSACYVIAKSLKYKEEAF